MQLWNTWISMVDKKYACLLHYNVHKKQKTEVAKNNLNTNITNCLYTPHYNMHNRQKACLYFAL